MTATRDELVTRSRVLRKLDDPDTTAEALAEGPIQLTWFTTAQAYETVNQVTNPSFGLGTAGWSGVNGTVTRDDDPDHSPTFWGSNPWHGVFTSDGTDTENYAVWGGPGDLAGTIPGREYSVGVAAHIDGVSGPVAGLDLRVALFAHTPAGLVLSNVSTEFATTGSSTRFMRATVPEDATGVELRIYGGSSAGDLIRFGGVTLAEVHPNQADTSNFIVDGGLGESTTDYSVVRYWWEGTPHASRSHRWVRQGDTRQLMTGDRLLSFDVRRGRQGANQQAQAGTMTFAFALREAADRDRIAVGDQVTMTPTYNALRWIWGRDDYYNHPEYHGVTRTNAYTAWVVAAELEHVPQGRGRPPLAVMRVTCTGPKARLGQLPLTPESPHQPLPYAWNEPLGDRWSRLTVITTTAIFNSWQYLTGPTSTGADAARMVGPLEAGGSALAALEDLAGAVGANLTESLHIDQRIVFDALDARANKAPIVELTAAEVAATVTWAQSLDGLVNVAQVEYGPEDARATAEARDTDSTAAYGEYGGRLSTPLLDEADAVRMAGLIVGRNSRPRWTISRLDVDLLDLALPVEKARQLWHGEAGDLIELVGLPSTTPEGRYFFLEGTEMLVTKHDWKLVVYVSAAEQTGAPLAWEDLPPLMTWATIPADRTWLNTAGWFIQLPPDVYRWTDVPTDLTYSALAPGADWDGDDTVPTWSSFPHAP